MFSDSEVKSHSPEPYRPVVIELSAWPINAGIKFVWIVGDYKPIWWD
jgi:hypothetical protein